MQKCEISEVYNAKRGSGPSKTFDFRIDFSLTFDVFSELTPRHNFSRVKAPVYVHKYDFGPIFDFPTVPKTTLGATCSTHETPKGGDGFCQKRSWSRPGREMASKTVQGRMFIDLGSFSARFWKDF